MDIIILGAGPAGLTAAYEAGKHSLHPIVLEKDSEVGGISKTVDHKGYLFDIGGHRFFTKYAEVRNLWEEILGDEFITRPRLSRIYYGNKFYYYPLKPLNALLNLGVITSTQCVLSYLWAQIRPERDDGAGILHLVCRNGLDAKTQPVGGRHRGIVQRLMHNRAQVGQSGRVLIHHRAHRAGDMACSHGDLSRRRRLAQLLQLRFRTGPTDRVKLSRIVSSQR